MSLWGSIQQVGLVFHQDTEGSPRIMGRYPRTALALPRVPKKTPKPGVPGMPPARPDTQLAWELCRVSLCCWKALTGGESSLSNRWLPCGPVHCADFQRPFSFSVGWSKRWTGDTHLSGSASVWAPTCTLGQVAIIFKAFLLIGLCLVSSTLQLIVFSPHGPLEVDLWAWCFSRDGDEKDQVFVLRIKQDNHNFQPLKDKTQILLHRLDLLWNNTETQKRCSHVGIRAF